MILLTNTPTRKRTTIQVPKSQSLVRPSSTAATRCLRARAGSRSIRAGRAGSAARSPGRGSLVLK